MVIVDTTVWVDYLKGANTPQAEWLELEMGRQRLGLTDLILCEVLQGVRGERRFADVCRELLKYEIFTTGGTELAIAAARNYRALRAKGYTVHRTIDCLIATFCLSNGYSLLHNDRDYDPFEQALGLRVIHP